MFNPHQYAGQGISPDQLMQLQRTLTLLNAEIAMHEKELHNFKELRQAERHMFVWLADSLIDPAVKRRPLEKFVECSKAHTEAEVELKILNIEKLKAERNITQAMIEEAGKAVRAPGGGRVQLT